MSCCSGGQKAIDRNGQVVLHAHPALYTIDRAQGVQQPIGLHANRLGVDIHVIAADPSPLRNIDTVIRSAHLGVKAIVASPIAAALACLNEEERELGVALVELGAEVTNVSVHYGGMLVGLRSIPLGARDITNDIAAAFAVQRRDAERLKCFYGSAMTSPRDNHEMIEATQIGAEQGEEPMKITRAQLMMVIRQRVEELTSEMKAALKGLGFTGPVGRQVVLTGGGAELKNIADYMQGVLGRAVRVGRPKQITGLPDAHSGPAFSTLVGLALLAASGRGDIRDIAGSVDQRNRGQGHDRAARPGDEGRLSSARPTCYATGAGGHGDASRADRRTRAGNLLVLLLGAAVFLNYVDRGAIGIAAPMMKGELGLSARPSELPSPHSSGSMRRCSCSRGGCAIASRSTS